MISEDLSKKDRINKEKTKLRKIFANIDTKTKKAVESLVDKAAFMSVTLEDLQNDINEKGVISEYQNGQNQWGTKKSPEVEVYNAMIKNYSGIMKQLTDLMPKAEPTQKEDEFEKFVTDR